MNNTKTNKRLEGKEGEDIAVEMLVSKGYQIIDRNFARENKGEIDIIAIDPADGCTVFIEVKMRKTLEYGEPEYAITSGKKSQIRKMAMAYIYEKDAADLYCRFDVVAILKLSGKQLEINHYEHAFE